MPPFVAHERIKQLYTWRDVARRTEIVYDMVEGQPQKDTTERLRRYLYNIVMCII